MIIPRQHIKKQRHDFADKGPYSQSYSQSYGSHVQMWELDHKEGWVLKNWCFRTVVLEKTLQSPLDSKEMKPVNPKGNQPWIFTGRTDAEAEAPILWPLGHLMRRTNSSEKTLMLEKIEGRWEGGHRGWAGWMAASIQWTWVWASSGRWWRTGKTGVLWSMGSQRVNNNDNTVCVYNFIYLFFGLFVFYCFLLFYRV